MLILSAALLLVADPGTPDTSNQAEIGYPANSLAYGALVTRDYALAERQLRMTATQLQDDPAWQINYGQLLAKQGRAAEAETAFKRAMTLGDSDVVLADGREISSREAARQALSRLSVIKAASR